jgi:4-O-beta-D-mannosyl-D-glucose phosphorylase
MEPLNEEQFKERLNHLIAGHETLIARRNEPVQPDNGVYIRYKHPVVTAEHAPIFWRYDLNPETNPWLIERLGVNAAFNAGAILHEGKYVLAVRLEGVDRKSFFAFAESQNGVDQFRFRDYPLVLPEVEDPDTSVYDMRLTRHEDGWIYGVFCTERKDPKAPPGDTSTAVAQCGIIRSENMEAWERLPDLKTGSAQQRNVVLHPEFAGGQYAFYTRPQDDFIETGSGGGIGWGLVSDITNPIITKETIIDPRHYHTVKESKNGLGPAPIKTSQGWLQLAHGVRNTAAGLRYTLYMFMTALEDPSRITHIPAGHLIAPRGWERVGDVSNVTFCNGWIENERGEVFIYYASSDTRMHVATSTVDRLVDYVMNTPEDGFTTRASVETRAEMIENNLSILDRS